MALVVFDRRREVLIVLLDGQVPARVRRQREQHDVVSLVVVAAFLVAHTQGRVRGQDRTGGSIGSTATLNTALSETVLTLRRSPTS